MTRLRYSKSSAHYLASNKEYFQSNDALLKEALGQNSVYAEQPYRRACKLCAAGLPPAVDLTSHGIDYKFCAACGHLNGVFDDTETFMQSLYISGDGDEYGKLLMDPAYVDRADSVYAPKADFLLTSLPDEEVSLLDVGCGGGHFVYSMLKAGARAKGIDVGKSVVEFGNAQISHQTGQSPLLLCDEAFFFDEVVKTDANVVSLVGVIEHLREPMRFFEAFRQSSAKYIFYSVPMFSMSALFENVFPGIFPRQLSGGHTHLFTESSITKMHELLGVGPVAEWRFGTDIMDLYRAMSINLQANHASDQIQAQLRAGLGAVIDDLQAVLDKNHFCSEIHVLAARAG